MDETAWTSGARFPFGNRRLGAALGIGDSRELSIRWFRKASTRLLVPWAADHNLVLWGDPATNAVLARIADKLPIQWTADKIIVGDRTFDAAAHALVMIYPNPLNPRRYVVLNSGFTYREFDDLNNARQVPKLPDWAVIDLSEAPGPKRPGRIAAAGFFDESWRLK